MEKTQIDLLSIERKEPIEGVQDVLFHTNEGTISGKFHPASEGTSAVLWVGGAGGGFDGPAGGLYPRMANTFIKDNISSLRLNYRFPNHLEECILDVLLGVEYLKSANYPNIILVGHSFGGAVVIATAGINKTITGVAAMSSQTHGTNAIGDLSPSPLLLLHGTEDEILPDTCSIDLYKRAKEPKQIILYAGCGHGLDECKSALDSDLYNWVKSNFNKNPF